MLVCNNIPQSKCEEFDIVLDFDPTVLRLESDYCTCLFLQGKSVTSVRMSIGVEEEISGLLTQPTSDILLLMDVQFTSQKWKDMFLWRVKQSLKSSQCMYIVGTCIVGWACVVTRNAILVHK